MTNKILDLLNKVFTFLASVSTSITGLADFPPFPFAALALAPLTGTWVYIKMIQRLITQKKFFVLFHILDTTALINIFIILVTISVHVCKSFQV